MDDCRAGEGAGRKPAAWRRDQLWSVLQYASHMHVRKWAGRRINLHIKENRKIGIRTPTANQRVSPILPKYVAVNGRRS